MLFKNCAATRAPKHSNAVLSELGPFKISPNNNGDDRIDIGIGEHGAKSQLSEIVFVQMFNTHCFEQCVHRYPNICPTFACQLQSYDHFVFSFLWRSMARSDQKKLTCQNSIYVSCFPPLVKNVKEKNAWGDAWNVGSCPGDVWGEHQ